MGYQNGMFEDSDGLVPRNGVLDEKGSTAEVEGRRSAAGTERGRLIEEMRAENERRSNLRVGSPNRMAKYDMGASAKVYGLRALATIVEIMENVNEQSAVRLAAAKEVLDRGFGKARQTVEHGGLDGDEIRNRLIIEFVGVPQRNVEERETSREFGADKDPRTPEPRALGGQRATPEPTDMRVNSGVPGGWQKAQRDIVKTVNQVNSVWAQSVNLDEVDDVEVNKEEGAGSS